MMTERDWEIASTLFGFLLIVTIGVLVVFRDRLIPHVDLEGTPHYRLLMAGGFLMLLVGFVHRAMRD